MPQLTPEQQDSLDEAVDRQMFRIHKLVTGMFGTGLTSDEMRRARQRIVGGVRQAMQQQERQGLPPGEGSRIYGDVNPALGDSLISNLAAQPGDQTLQNPILREPPTPNVGGPI